MSHSSIPPVLIIGGSGVVGSLTASFLRQSHPGLPIAIGGRDLGRAAGVAASLGHASGVQVDLDRQGLGLPAGSSFSAVVVFVKDSGLNAMKFALEHRLPYLSLSSGIFETGPEMALHIRQPGRSAILMASQWLAGVTTLPALHFAREFQRVDEIAISAVLDEQDMGGPAASADFERMITATPLPLILQEGRWLWAGESLASRTVTAVDGVEQQARAYSPLDVLSLATATTAKSIRFDLVYGESAGTRAGRHFTTEATIEIRGEGPDGKPLQRRHELVHPLGQAPVTALSVVLSVEQLLGLTGKAPTTPGLYFPENIIEPAAYLERLQAAGLEVTSPAR